MRNLIIAGLLAGTLAAPAFAQDVAKAPFTGFRVEGLVGYDSLRSGDSADDDVDTNDDEGDESIDGLLYGVGVGFDLDVGGFVIGAEGELSDSTGKQEFDETIDAPFVARVEPGRDFYVGGRVGFRASDRALVYAKAGYTNTAIDFTIDDDGDETDSDLNIDGYRLGAGLEYLFGTNAYGKIEYRYSKYGDLEFDESNAELDIDLDRHQVVAGVGFRF